MEWVSIGAVIISLVSLILSRSDKNNTNEQKDSYKWGTIDEKLDNIEKQLVKIENKLDYYDTEIDTKIEKAIKDHIAIYHKKRKEE